MSNGHEHEHEHDHSHDHEHGDERSGGHDEYSVGSFIEPAVARAGIALDALDPADVAPTIVVANEARMSNPGHGYRLPLVGNTRPHIYDMVFDGGRRRAYADTHAALIDCLIDGYSALAARCHEAAAARDTAAWTEADAEAFVARTQWFAAQRPVVQRRERNVAVASGAWGRISEQEREQVDLGVEGDLPTGVIFLHEVDGVQGSVEVGYWDTDAVNLVVNLGEYAQPHHEGVPVPRNGVGDVDEEGAVVVTALRWPRGFVLLDPTDEALFLESAERAGLISITTRDPMPVDDVFTNAMATGERERVQRLADQHGVAFGTV